MRVPRKARRGGVSKVIFKSLCQLLAIDTTKWLQERANGSKNERGPSTVRGGSAAGGGGGTRQVSLISDLISHNVSIRWF